MRSTSLRHVPNLLFFPVIVVHSSWSGVFSQLVHISCFQFFLISECKEYFGIFLRTYCVSSMMMLVGD